MVREQLGINLRPSRAQAAKMRIVAGSLKGRRLASPEGRDIRPTADRTRQALFDILEHGHLIEGGGSALVDAIVLDAFCGTGALGLEALSRGRGGGHIHGYESRSPRCARANAKALGIAANFILADATNPPRARSAANLVFLDPPYEFGPRRAGACWRCAMRAGSRPVRSSAWRCRDRALSRFALPDGFSAAGERRYGKARILLLRAGG